MKTSGAPHSKLRQGCKWCPKKGHNKTPSGNTHRMHKKGAFCATHSTTKIGRLYCVSGHKRKKPLGTSKYRRSFFTRRSSATAKKKAKR